MGGDGLSLAQAAGLDLLHLLRVLALDPVLEALVELLVGAAGLAANGAVDGPGEGVTAVVLGEALEDVEPVRLRDPAEEAGAVEVPEGPLRPAHRAGGEVVETCDVVLQHVGAEVHVEDGGAEPAAARLVALHEGGEALDDPAGLGLVGRIRLPKDGVDDRRDARDVVDVEDVRVLVGDERQVPVVVVVQRGEVVRRGDEQVDVVVREGGRGAVGVVRGVGDEHLRAARGRVAERADEALVRHLGHLGHALGDRLQSGGVVDTEVLRLDGPPLEIGVADGVRGRGREEGRGGGREPDEGRGQA